MTSVLDPLRELVACDTRNPPRAITRDDHIFQYLGDQLAGFEIEVVDEGDSSVSLLAVRGKPRTLVNVHLDTVPDNELWTRDPFTLSVEGERAYGLGACDIKGGAAALVAAAHDADGDVALLLSADEEYGHSRCVHGFLSSGRAWLNDVELVVVAEPTQGRAVLAHRGFARGEAVVVGEPGHSADPRGLDDNANHRLASWLVNAMDVARARDGEGELGLTGLRFNCGIVRGGHADNVITAEARATFSVRPPPGADPHAAALALASIAPARGEVLFTGPPLPADDAEARAERARAHAEALGVEVAAPVDFWTEASLFSQAGFVTFVCGPGDIANAHVADESVALAELDRAHAFFRRVIEAEL